MTLNATADDRQTQRRGIIIVSSAEVWARLKPLLS